jgi:hypothetical protein
MQIKLRDSRWLFEKEKKSHVAFVRNSRFSKKNYILPIFNYSKQFSKIIYKIFSDAIVENFFLTNSIGIMWSNWNFDDYTNRHIVVTGGHFAKFQNLSPPRPYIELFQKVGIIRGMSKLRFVVGLFSFRWLNFLSGPKTDYFWPFFMIFGFKIYLLRGLFSKLGQIFLNYTLWHFKGL